MTEDCPWDAIHEIAEEVRPCPLGQPLQGHLRPQAGEAPQSFAVPRSSGETVLGVIKLAEVNAEFDFWILQQEVVDFTHAAVESLIARRVVGVEDNAAQVSTGTCECIQITTCLKQHRFRVAALGSTVCSMAFLDCSA